jgi:hypothetical protein
MTLAAKVRRLPLRVATGAYILNAGIGKLKADEETAKMLHGMGSGAYPVLQKLQPPQFAKTLAISETALGAALLLPIVPAGLAGLALTGFAGSLLGMWWKTPGMHEEGSIKPTMQGTPIAKDVWMLGIGTSLLLDSLLTDSSALGIETRAKTRATVKAEAKAARKSAQRAAKLAKSALPG